MHWRSRRMWPYERTILATLPAVASTQASEAVRNQLSRIRIIQRHTHGKEVNLYLQDSRIPRQWLVPSPFRAWPIATVSCRWLPSQEVSRASIWMVSGRVFSIIFSDLPIRMNDRELTVLSTELLFDPFAPGNELVAPTSNIATRPQSIAQILPNATQILRAALSFALPARLQERFLSVARHCLPADYCELMTETNGFEVNEWRVTGLPLDEIAMERYNLFVLARSRRGEMLCVRDGDSSQKVILVDAEDLSETPMGQSFIAALASRISPAGMMSTNSFDEIGAAADAML